MEKVQPMLVFVAKLKGKSEQYYALDGAIRTGQFIRNSCLRYWMDNRDVGKKEMFRYNTQLRNNPEFPWAKQLNSHARHASVERTWFAITRFYDNCKKGKQGLKGYPSFKKNTRSVEYKTSGWKLNETRDRITFSDGFEAGTFKLIGSRDLNYCLEKLLPQKLHCDRFNKIPQIIPRQNQNKGDNVLFPLGP